MRFVSPETVRIPLPESFEDVQIDVKNEDGSITKRLERQTIENWIEVKKDLNVGDEKRLESFGFKRAASQSEEVDIDWALRAIGRVLVYLVDWSAKDAKGEKVAITRSSIESLDTDDFDQIDKAIVAHIKKVDAEKKARSGRAMPTKA